MRIGNIASLALAIAFTFAGAAQAAPAQDADNGAPVKPLTTQQQRMKDCNAQAKAQSLKGDERRGFMSTCLKGGSTRLAAHAADTPATASPAQLKRKACSAEAKQKGLKGDERNAYVRDCIADDDVASTN